MRFSTFILFFFGVVYLMGDLNHGRMSIIPEYDQNIVTILFSGHRADDTKKTPFLFTVPLDVDSVSLIKNNPNDELDFVLIPTRLIKGHKWVEVSSELSEFAFMINSTKFLKPGCFTLESGIFKILRSQGFLDLKIKFTNGFCK